MKKQILLAALMLATTCSFAATNKNVTKARNLCDAENPDYSGARDAIKEALQDEMAVADPYTWYMAGYIGYKQYSTETMKMQIGQGGSDQLRGDVEMESLEYWATAYEKAQVPLSYDKKGNPKYDTKTVKLIVPKVVEYYKGQALISAGFAAYENHDYSKAYDMFMRYLNIPEMPLMQSDPKALSELLIDTMYYTCMYYAGRFAYEAERYNDAIQTLQRMNSEKATKIALHKEVIFANEYIYQCYIDQKDTTNAVAVLKECINTFKEEPWFMQSLINLYINSGQEEKAVEYLDLAIQREPNVGQYYNSKASIMARIGKFEESFKVFEQALSLEPNNALFYESCGFAYVDLGNKLNDEAAYLDAKEYAKAKKNIDAAFNNALPYFKKAYELDPTNDDYKRSLRQLYYRLGMYDEYQALGN